MPSLDRMLIGTSWVRAITSKSRSHHLRKGVIDDVSPKGPRLRIASRGGNSEFIRPRWVELDISWKPADNRSQKQFDMWKDTREIERLHKEITMVESTMPQPEMVECTALFHKKDKLVEKSNSYVTRKGNIVCLDCKALRGHYNEVRKEKQATLEANQNKIGRALEVASPMVAEYKMSDNGMVPVEDLLPTWHITVIQSVIVTVHAKDFLDAASQVSDRGEIVKVERL